MCLHPELIPPVPEVTAKVAKSAFPKGNRYMHLRDELGVFYNDEEFTERRSSLDDWQSESFALQTEDSQQLRPGD